MDHFSLEKPFGDRSTIRKHILFSLFFFLPLRVLLCSSITGVIVIVS